MGDARLEELAIVIPTRNRSDLVGFAVRSALKLGRSPMRVFVSDNSTDVAESRDIEALTRSIADERLTLLRPPQPLSMTKHWNWVMSEVLQRSSASHVAYLTDRMIFRTALFEEAVAISVKFPGDIVSYADDRLEDEDFPIVYRPSIRSGTTYRIQSQSLLELSARMVFYTCLPRMLNCIAPRAHIEKLGKRYGNYFDSASPDFCFCYRSLEATESILYLDKSVMLSHGHGRSNGHSFIRGVSTEASKDYLKDLAGTQINVDTPLPNVRTVGNAIASEYLRVRRETGSAAMPALSMPAYLDFLASETSRFTDIDHAKAVRRELTDAGWKGRSRSRWQGRKTAIKEWLHSLTAQHYNDADVAIRRASMDGGRLVPWIHGMARSYRCEEVDIT